MWVFLSGDKKGPASVHVATTTHLVEMALQAIVQYRMEVLECRPVIRQRRPVLCLVLFEPEGHRAKCSHTGGCAPAKPPPPHMVMDAFSCNLKIVLF
jgi:hypothetical protein